MPKLYYASTKDPDMFYAIGMHISDPFFLIDLGDKKYIFLDHREYGVFQEHNTDQSIELVLLNPFFEEAHAMLDDTSLSNKIALLLLQKYDLLAKPIHVSRHFPLDMADYLRSKGARLHVQIPFSPELMKKTSEQIGHIRDSLRRTQEAFQWIEEVLRESTIENNRLMYHGTLLTSEFLKGEVERVLLKEDMVNVEGIIISCAEHSAIPHHPGHSPIRPHQTIVCDIFPRRRSNGYFADMTRTYVKGTPSAHIQRMYEAVRLAQDKGFELIKPGVVGKDVHAACATIFVDHGFHVGENGFNHGLGHGLGLEVHELPSAGSTSTSVLEPGHVITVEPGLYYPEHGGVRIEDVVVVTETGCENLTNYPRELVIP